MRRPSTVTEARVTRWSTTRISAWDHPIRVEDVLDAFDRLKHARQVRDVGELEGEAKSHDPVATRGGRRGQDVHVVVGERGRDVGQQASAIEGLDLAGTRERGGLALAPGDVDEAFGLLLERLCVRAVRAVHRHALAAGHEPHDLVARYRSAASAEPHP